MTTDTIGIVGLGYVGNAVYKSYNFTMADIKTIDTNPSKLSTHSYKDLENCDAVFICVPSPMKSDGSCDSTILESVLANLKNFRGVLISKVTATPDVYQRLNDQYPNLVHVPEFLTASNAYLDYLNSSFAIIGGKIPAFIREAERIIKIGQSHLKEVHYCSIEEAAFCKYVINSFLATKVVFMNELKALADAAGIDYNIVSRMISSDYRIGPTHLQVPGPDGSLGFGGGCFPKDVQALLKYAESINADLNIIDTANRKNTMLRLTKPK
jgi:nucleotide sugar dehydrogenase